MMNDLGYGERKERPVPQIGDVLIHTDERYKGNFYIVIEKDYAQGEIHIETLALFDIDPEDLDAGSLVGAGQQTDILHWSPKEENKTEFEGFKWIGNIYDAAEHNYRQNEERGTKVELLYLKRAIRQFVPKETI